MGGFWAIAKRASLLILGLLLLVAAATVTRSEYVLEQANLQPIAVPIEVHIIQGLTVNRGETPLTNWITREDVQRAIPGINDIWRQAAITWQVRRIDEIDVSTLDQRKEWARLSETVHRLSPPDQVRRKRRFLQQIADQLTRSDTRFHVFIVPYHGWTTAGESVWGNEGKQYVFLSAWIDDVDGLVDHPTGRNISLKPASLDNKQSGFVRTAAHELGHALALLHNTCARDCLMGGTISSGDRLTPYQIQKARSRIERPGPISALYDSLEMLWLRVKWGDPR